jgi:hypothetical protein
MIGQRLKDGHPVYAVNNILFEEGNRKENGNNARMTEAFYLVGLISPNNSMICLSNEMKVITLPF